jgi:mycothiol synthase
MYATIELDNAVTLLEAPSIPKPIFRGFYGEEDYPAMAAVIAGSKDEDGQEWALSVEDIARNYRHLHNCDPEQDMLFVEADGEVVGYGRVWGTKQQTATRLYQQFAHLLPDWRGQGIRRAMLHHNECRLRRIAGGHPADGPRMFEAWASETETHWRALLLDEGYEAMRYGFEMVRPDLDEIPDLPLPEGLQVRPVQAEQVPLIWAAAREAFRDHWGYSEDEWSDENLKEWQESPTYDPGLWQVAWDGDQVAGMVLNFVNLQENEEYGRQRGYTEGICVRRPWRRQGVARALIARSFWVLRGLGMTEAALGVDAQNPNGALRLYQSMGFESVKRHTTYRKPLA